MQPIRGAVMQLAIDRGMEEQAIEIITSREQMLAIIRKRMQRSRQSLLAMEGLWGMARVDSRIMTTCQ
jgi:hypothetical protein